jgi:hypothetical protein
MTLNNYIRVTVDKIRKLIKLWLSYAFEFLDVSFKEGEKPQSAGESN